MVATLPRCRVFGRMTRRDVFHQSEREMSAYNFEHANVDALLAQFDICERECGALVEKGPSYPACEQVLRGSHTFNLLDAWHAVSVTERQRFILRVRSLARAVAECCYGSREVLGFPIGGGGFVDG